MLLGKPPSLVLMREPPQDRRRAKEARWGHTPKPPAEDVLPTPLFLLKPPHIVLPNRTWLQRLALWEAPEVRHRRKLHAMIASVMNSVAPRTVWDIEKNKRMFGLSKSKPELTSFRITHPYQLKDIFKELITANERHLIEYRAIELLLAMILREYIKSNTAARGESFSFEAESRKHGLRGAYLENYIKMVTHQGERESMIKNIYECYFHSINYYVYSILSREKIKSDGTLFSIYCRGLFFMARIDERGGMHNQPSRHNLPKRKDVMFLIMRDQALRQRYNRDLDFASKIKDVVKYFPTDSE